MITIKCKKLGNVVSLTLNTEYTVVNESETRYSIINDKGVQKNYCKSLFDEISELVPIQPRAPRQPRRVPEPAIPLVVIPEVEELEITTNIDDSSDQAHLNFNLNIKFINDFVYTKNFRNLEIYDSTISCGVLQISNIDGFKNEIGNLKIELQNYINNNIQNFKLTEDFNIDEIVTDITKALVQDMISYFQGDDADNETKAGILILSTTSASINQLPSLKEAFNAVSTVTETRNPNSGNMITMWTIVVNE